jgi:hypothetical protein
MHDTAKRTTYSIRLRPGRYRLDGRALKNIPHRAVVCKHTGPVCLHCHGTGHLAPRLDAEALVTAIAAAEVAGSIFTVKELKRHAKVTGGPLLDMIEHISARKIGHTLANIEGVVIDGAKVERIGDERAGITWAIRLAS